MDQAFPIFSLWSLFWSIYFITSVRRKRFTQNYIEAWRQNYPDYAIPVFFDRSSCLRIPCPDPNDPALDDAWIWSHLSFFYRISRIEGGIAPVLLPKSLSRLETVEVSSLLSLHGLMRMQSYSSFSGKTSDWTCVTRTLMNPEDA